MIKKTEVRELVFNQLIKVFESTGFKFQKSKNRLLKKTDFGWLAIELLQVDYYPVMQKFNYLFEVRHNSIENILEEAFELRKDIRNTRITLLTLIDELTTAQVPYLKNLSTVRSSALFEVKAIEELNHVLKAIEPILNQGIHFFEKYSDLRNIHTYLNIEKKSEMPFNPYIGAQKLLIAYYCDKSLKEEIHLNNLEEILPYIDNEKAQYLNLYNKLLSENINS